MHPDDQPSPNGEGFLSVFDKLTVDFLLPVFSQFQKRSHLSRPERAIAPKNKLPRMYG
jgi:hypothetical protein